MLRGGGKLLIWTHSEHNERNTPAKQLWIVHEDEKCQIGKPCHKLLKSVSIFFSLPNNLTDFFFFICSKKKELTLIFCEKFDKFMYFYISPKLVTFCDAQTFLETHSQERRRHAFQDDTKIYFCVCSDVRTTTVWAQKKTEEAVARWEQLHGV